MRRALIMLGSAIVLIPDCSYARYTFVPIIIEHKEIWNVEKDTPFATWQASSSFIAGSEIDITPKNDVVDKAALLPESVYAVDQDFSGNDSLLIPKGGTLIKMAGGDEKWYCTWKYGDHANSTATDVWEKRELCLHADAGQQVTDATLEVTLYPEVMTILPSVIAKHVKNFSAVTLHPVESSLLPSRSDLVVHARLKGGDQGSVCLRYTMTPLFSHETCFGGIGQSLSMLGGTYTLLSTGADHSAKIRIDRALNVADIRPRPRSH